MRGGGHLLAVCVVGGLRVGGMGGLACGGWVGDALWCVQCGTVPSPLFVAKGSGRIGRVD